MPQHVDMLKSPTPAKAVGVGPCAVPRASQQETPCSATLRELVDEHLQEVKKNTCQNCFDQLVGLGRQLRQGVSEAIFAPSPAFDRCHLPFASFVSSAWSPSAQADVLLKLL